MYSLTCPLMPGLILVAIPKYTKGKLSLVAKNRKGEPLKSKVEALDQPRDHSGYMPAPPGTVDKDRVATAVGTGAAREIMEWQAIMAHIRNLPVQTKGDVAMGWN